MSTEVKICVPWCKYLCTSGWNISIMLQIFILWRKYFNTGGNIIIRMVRCPLEDIYFMWTFYFLFLLLTVVGMFPPRWEHSHRGENILTAVETFPPRWEHSHRDEKYFHRGENIATAVRSISTAVRTLPPRSEVFPPRWKPLFWRSFIIDTTASTWFVRHFRYRSYCGP